jgi:hypothetical protein
VERIEIERAPVDAALAGFRLERSD